MDPNLDWYDVIDDFYPVMGSLDTVLIPRNRAGSTLHVGIATAIAAAAGRLKSLDWTRDAYVDEDQIHVAGSTKSDIDMLREAYEIGVAAISEGRDRLRPPGTQAPLGVYAASIALERFPVTLKSVHLLYLLGHRNDGDVVARSGLEQLAWSYLVSPATTNEELEAVRSSAAVKTLKALHPDAGRLYGQLSHSAHMDVFEHLGPVTTEREGTAIVMRQYSLEWSALVLLKLADIWLSVWEATQHKYLPYIEHVHVEDRAQLRIDRPFAEVAQNYMKELREHLGL